MKLHFVRSVLGILSFCVCVVFFPFAVVAMEEDLDENSPVRTSSSCTARWMPRNYAKEVARIKRVLEDKQARETKTLIQQHKAAMKSMASQLKEMAAYNHSLREEAAKEQAEKTTRAAAFAHALASQHQQVSAIEQAIDGTFSNLKQQKIRANKTYSLVNETALQSLAALQGIEPLSKHRALAAQQEAAIAQAAYMKEQRSVQELQELLLTQQGQLIRLQKARIPAEAIFSSYSPQPAMPLPASAAHAPADRKRFLSSFNRPPG